MSVKKAGLRPDKEKLLRYSHAAFFIGMRNSEGVACGDGGENRHARGRSNLGERRKR